MKYLLAIFIIIVLIVAINDLLKRRKLKEFKKSLLEKWGLPKIRESYDFDLIGKYFYDSPADDTSIHQRISDKTCNDLDLHNVFRFLDRTSSKIGQQYLYHKLRTLSHDIDHLKKFDSLVELFSASEDLRLFSQAELQKLSTTNAYYIEELIYGKYPKKPAWLPLAYILSGGAIACLILAPFYRIAILLLLPIFIANLVIFYWNKRNINSSLLAISEFLKSIQAGKKLAEQAPVKGHFGELSFLHNLSKLKNKTRFISFEKRVDDDITMVVSFAGDLLKIMFNIEILSYFNFIDTVFKARPHIHALFRYLGEIDAAISTASVRQSTDTCKPQFIDDKKVHYENIVHPLIISCVPNNLDLAQQSLLLTGSNMSGKTTFIRTVAINTILAQTLYTCFAKEYVAPFMRVYTSIHISDELLEGKSYYLQEVLSIKELVDESSKEGNCLFILDELFKGTNTLERISAGKAILSYLNKGKHIVLVSTHDIELTDLLVQQQYQLYHFAEHVENNELSFDYKLKEGPLTTRNAIKILELYKYPSDIITDANETLKKF